MYDVLVIGAGPAGSAAAYHASRAGLRVVVVDRKEFPRGKACGDAVNPRALAAIARMDVRDLTGHTVRGVRIKYRHRSRFEDYAQHGWPHRGAVIAREVLDSVLLTRAREVGADFRVGYAQRLMTDGSRVIGATIQTEAGVRMLHARTVVAATGSGLCGDLLSGQIPARPVWGIAGRTYVEFEGEAGDELEVYFPVFHDGRLLSGYGWIFPVGPRCVNIGLGVFRTGRVGSLQLHRMVERFIARRAFNDTRFRGARRLGPILSGPIAVGPHVDTLKGLLLVGDLAGLAHPFTGEGIAAAIESGELAAHAIVTAGDEAVASYRRALERRLRSHFVLRRALVTSHAQPQLLLGRGADLLTAPGGAIVSTLRNVIWDIPWPHTGLEAADASAVRRAIEGARDEIVRTSDRLRPLFGEMARHLMLEPHVGFGWYAGLAAAVQVGLANDASPLPPLARSIVVTLELANLVAFLHGELPGTAQSTGQMRTWGRQTLSLMMADSLTASALRLLYGLPATWADRLGAILRCTFRDAAGKRSTTRVPAIASTADELFLLAARAALQTAPTRPMPQVVKAVAAGLVSLRKQPCIARAPRVELLQQTLAGSTRPLARAMAALLRTVIDGVKATDPVEAPPQRRRCLVRAETN